MNAYSVETGNWIDRPYKENVPAYYDPEEFMESRDTEELLLTALKSLPEDLRSMIIDYYGLGEYAPLTLTKLSQKYGKTTYFVKADLTKAMQIMRKTLGVEMMEEQ